MRVLHVVTLHTPTHDFGGPTRVALNLSRQLRARGVDSRVAALGDGFDGPLPDTVEGVPVWLFQARHVLPAFEVSGITSPALLARAHRLMRSADVVHVHLMRDLITLPLALIALRAGRPLVLQTHGMIDPTENRVAKVVDLLGLRRALRGADAILHLTEMERRDVEAVVAPAPLTGMRRLANGVRTQEPRPASAREDRAAAGQPPTVVFLARVQARKRPEDFIAAMPVVLGKYPDARFVLAGPDTGPLADEMLALAGRLGVRDSVEYVGALSHEAVLEQLRQADVYVLPSVVEPLGVSALEAMSVGAPTIVTRTCGLAPDIEEAGAGRVVDSRADADNGPLVGEAILELLDPAENARTSGNAWRLIRDRFTIEGITDTLQGVYEEVVGRRGR